MHAFKKSPSTRALVAALLAASAALASPFVRSEFGHPEMCGKTFQPNFYQPEGTSGDVVANTNLFTGQPSYTIGLHTVGTRDDISFPVSLSFSGPTLPTLENNNDLAPAGWIGAGWSLNMPFVAISHMGTATFKDDIITANLGQYGGGQILQEQTTPNTYYIVSAPSIRIQRDTIDDSGHPMFRQTKSWTFTMPDGVKMIFGDSRTTSITNSERILQSNAGTVIASPYNTSTSTPIIYRWDLRRIEDNSGSTGLDFTHSKTETGLWGGLTYTSESYPSNIYWRNEFGDEIQRVEFTTEALNTGEYVGYFPNEDKSSQKLFETKRLKRVRVINEGSPVVSYELSRSVLDTKWGKKGLLSGIGISYGDRQSPGWSFTYRDEDFLLEDILLPNGATETFQYTQLGMTGTDGDQEPAGTPFIDHNGLPLLAQDASSGRWTLEANCDDRFCYEIVRDTTTVSNADSVWVRVTYNSGNYFNYQEPAFEALLTESSTDADKWSITSSGNSFFITNTVTGEVSMYMWRGKSFEHVATNNYTADIQLMPAGNYFLVVKPTAPSQVWAYLRDSATGEWNHLTQSSDCVLFNSPVAKTNAGVDINHHPPGNTMCLVWNSPIQVSVSGKMFIVRTTTDDVLYTWALNRTGTSFDLVSNAIQYIGSTVQTDITGGGNSPANWLRPISSIQMGNDYFIIKDRAVISTTNPVSRYYVMFWDGSVIKNIGQLAEETDSVTATVNSAAGSNQERNVWLGDGYFVHANTNTSDPRIEFWRRKASGSDIVFEYVEDIRTDPPREGLGDLKVSTGSRFIAVEYYPNGTFASGSDPITYPDQEGGNGDYMTWMYKINESGEIDGLHDSLYSYKWPLLEGELSQCTNRLWNISFVGPGDLARASAARSASGDPCTCENTDNCEYQLDRSVSIKSNYASANARITPLAPLNSFWSQLKNRSYGAGGSISLSLEIMQDGVGNDSIISRRYFYNGRDYAPGFDATVVENFVQETDPDGYFPPSVTAFEYGSGSTVTEFNHHTLVPHFEHTLLSRTGLPGGTEYLQFVDHAGKRLVMDSASLVGRTRCKNVRNGSDALMATECKVFDPAYTRGFDDEGNPDGVTVNPWPYGASVNRVTKTISREWDANGGFQSDTIFYYAFSDSLETPRFSVVSQGGRDKISQIILDGTGRHIEHSLSYDYPSDERLTKSEFEASEDTPLETSGLEEKYALAYSGSVYDPYFTYRINQSLMWRDTVRYTLVDDLKQAPIPNYNLSYSVFEASNISQRDAIGLVLESAFQDRPGHYKYGANFYEGRAAYSVGVVTNSRLDNAAVLTAENGSVTGLGSYLDRQSIWTGPGVTYSADLPHTGRFSFKVTDNYGPTVKLYLKDVEDEKFGVIASAWVYGTSGMVPPVFVVARRHGNASPEDSVVATAVEGSYAAGRWQRWEARIPHEDLIAGDMFEDESGDYLEIRIGTHAQGEQGNSSRIIYVDDIVLRPDNSTFALTAYNINGQPIQSTDTHHRILTTEYGFAGQPIATRDETGKITNQQGQHLLGENLP